MGYLPTKRVVGYHLFVNTDVDVDYTVSFLLKINRRTSFQTYAAIFVCMASKAIHIELVSDASSKALIAALTRFVTRREKCYNLYSDNGTNFVRAKSELDALHKIDDYQKIYQKS
jgi:hypothetical protein